MTELKNGDSPISKIEITPDMETVNLIEALRVIAEHLPQVSSGDFESAQEIITKVLRMAASRLELDKEEPVQHVLQKEVSTNSENVIKKVIDSVSSVRLDSFQEYIFTARRGEGRKLEITGGYDFNTKEDIPHNDIHQIKLLISGNSGGEIIRGDLKDESGHLYLVVNNKNEGGILIWGGGRIGIDYLDRGNNVSFEIVLPTLELARKLVSKLKGSPHEILEKIMFSIFVDEEGKELLPLAKNRTEDRQFINPFASQITKTTMVNIAKEI